MELSLASLDTELWKRYSSAYGDISPGISKLLDASLEDGERREVLEEIFEAVSHQMSFYPALWLALPYLVQELDREKEFEEQVFLIGEIGCCLATDFPANRELYPAPEKEVEEAYAGAKEMLREMVQSFFRGQLEALRRLNPSHKNFFCTGVLAILGDPEAAFALISSGWEACYLLCPSCGQVEEELELSDMNQLENIRPAPLAEDWDQTTFQDTYQWFGGLLKLLGAGEDRRRLSYYYGTYTCPECGEQGLVMDWMKGYFSEG